MGFRCRRCRGEEGAFLVVWALLLVALFTMVAIVVDLGALRADRRKERAAADAAAAAGANDLLTSPDAACSTALKYAVTNLGFDAAPYSCGGIGACDIANPTVVTEPVGDYRVAITYPVRDDSHLMKAEAVGGDITQTAAPVPDGAECDRIGVEVGYTRESFFGGIVGNTSNSTKVHSVARYVASVEDGGEKPALVALEPTARCTVDAGTGKIHAFATGDQPALIYADSDGLGPNCPSGSGVFEGKPAGRIWANPSPTTGAPGGLGYFAGTLALAFDTQPNYDENNALPPVGANKIRLLERITRRPLDKIYNCASVVPASPPVPGCTTGPAGTDFIDSVSTRYANLPGAPLGFVTFPDASVPGTCTNPPATFPGGQNWYIDCGNFEVASAVTFENGDIIFAGDVEIKGGGVLTINSLNATDTIVVIKGTTGIETASGGWALDWRRTFVLMDNPTCSRASPSTCGVLQFQVGQPSAWTPPLGGGGKDLIYWTESTDDHEVYGNPNFFWEGIFAAPNSRFAVQGTAAVDATDVQLWVAMAQVNGTTAELLLRADPDKSISTSKTGSALIR